MEVTSDCNRGCEQMSVMAWLCSFSHEARIAQDSCRINYGLSLQALWTENELEKKILKDYQTIVPEDAERNLPVNMELCKTILETFFFHINRKSIDEYSYNNKNNNFLFLFFFFTCSSSSSSWLFLYVFPTFTLRHNYLAKCNRIF